MLNRRKKIAAGLICGIFAVSGCAVPETEEDMKNTYVSEQVEELSDVNNLLEEQGRSVNCTLATPEGLLDIEIQATITIPETTVEEGEFEQTLPSVDQIEDVFTNGEKMEQNTSEELTVTGSLEWEIPLDIDGELYQMSYLVNQEYHMGRFRNTSIKDMADYPYTEENCPDEVMAEKMQELTQQVENIYEQFGMKVKPWMREIGKEDEQYMAYIIELSIIDDIPLVTSDYGFVTNNCFISEEGVSSITFEGSFMTKNTQEVSVMSIDDLLEVLTVRAESGEIGAGETITEITLAYCLDFESQTFYPVWCLYGDTVDICINAQTGEVV